MGVDTKIKIPFSGNLNNQVNDIVKVLKKLNIFGDITTEITHHPQSDDKFRNYEMWRIFFALDNYCEQFSSKKEQRQLTVYYDYYNTNYYLVSISMGAWGSNEEIGRLIVYEFGGFMDLSDCDDIIIDYAKPQPKK